MEGIQTKRLKLIKPVQIISIYKIHFIQEVTDYL